MSEENIFSEVDEELRNERMRNLWRKFAPLIIGVVLAIILGVAAKEGWTYYKKSVSSASSDKFYAAIELADSGDIVGAQQALDLVIAEGSGQYPLLAQFRQAALLLETGKNQQAIAAYDALANSTSDKRLRELALIYAASALVDTGDVAAVNARIGGLISPDNSMSTIAQELLGLTQYVAGDLDNAYQTFTSLLSDPLAQSENIARVQIYVAQLLSQGANSAPEKENLTPSDETSETTGN